MFCTTAGVDVARVSGLRCMQCLASFEHRLVRPTNAAKCIYSAYVTKEVPGSNAVSSQFVSKTMQLLSQGGELHGTYLTVKSGCFCAPLPTL